MAKRLEGKVAIVTGGAQGIGKASVETLARHGANVAIADLNREAASALAGEISANGGEAIAIPVDVAEETLVAEMTEKVLAAFGRIDVLYNNAALLNAEMAQQDRDVAAMNVDVWDKVMAVNLRGPMLCSKHVLPAMIKQNGGSIIFASSGMGVQGEITRSAYAASKAALIMLSKSIATQYGKKGVRSNAIQIGYLPPEDDRKSTPKEVQDILSSHNLIPEHLRTQNIADVVAFLASDESAAITGTLVTADGGFSAHTPSMNDMIEFAKKLGRNEM